MKKAFVAALVSASTVVAVVACSSGGSNGSGGGAGAVSSVDSSKSMNSLSDSEAKQYCEDAQNYQKTQLGDADRKKFTCVLTARILASFGAKDDADAKSKCQEQFDKCMAGPDPNADAGAQAAACDNFKARLTNCTATVAEANQCVADSATEYKSIASEEPCANVHADAGSSSASFFSQPASCDVLSQKCPGLAGSSSTSGSSGG